ncbi:hypothetical protein [Stenotrophomonas mori]|uniref:Plasmid stabilization protein ParE n=1 Tax=Stenotrophomonas mori TaxID=2871096 RepID=A0ABT0SHI8_9GAMM|nr:hypothetical protein [Stenotrophomonas mori]MCL7714439.1 hypothetical protein [Stenotrophomonas mori]
MTTAPATPPATPAPLSERLYPWAAALVSALLHVLIVLLLLHSSPPLVTTPQGTAGGGRVKVDFVGEAPATPEPSDTPPAPAPEQRPRPEPRSAPRRAPEARKPVPEARYIEPPAEPEPQPQDRREAEAAQPAAASRPPQGTQRHPRTWTGRPPGWQPQDTAPSEHGRTSGPPSDDGYRNDMAAGEPAMEVGGYQIVYDLLSETRLRTWMAQGMKELSIPLPGTTYLMVCPAEVALRRGSSKCRLLPPDAPELQTIGDARQVVTVMYVYRRGELVWRGPGPYR